MPYTASRGMENFPRLVCARASDKDEKCWIDDNVQSYLRWRLLKIEPYESSVFGARNGPKLAVFSPRPLLKRKNKEKKDGSSKFIKPCN